MASRFLVLLGRAAIRSPASSYGLLRRSLAAGPSTLGTVVPATQGLRHYAGPCRPDLNEAVGDVQRTVGNIETTVCYVARRLDELEEGDSARRMFHAIWFGAGYGFIAGLLVHSIISSKSETTSSEVARAKTA